MAMAGSASLNVDDDPTSHSSVENDMIGQTGMVDSYDVSLSSSFIRKEKLELDEARTERNVAVTVTIYHSCLIFFFFFFWFCRT